MDIPNLFALTTQTKPSSFLANALPSKPLEGLENSVTNLELQAKNNDILENISDMLAQNIYSQEQSLNGEDV